MFDIIGEIIIMLIFNYPGAGIRWMISRLWGSKKTFKEFAHGDIYTNGLVGLAVIIPIFVIIFR